jgi:hypothetical protein
MSPRKSARLARPEPALDKDKANKVNKPKKATRATTTMNIAKNAATSKTVKAKARKTTLTTHTAKSSAPLAAKTFICGCVEDCRFKVVMKDLRIVLGRPEFNQDPVAKCTCRVHYRCAKLWAQAHDEVPYVLPCGCPMTPRGTDFWVRAVPGRVAQKEDAEKEKQKKAEEEKEIGEENGVMVWDFDSGSDLTDLED